jgi:hypothetical protein
VRSTEADSTPAAANSGYDVADAQSPTMETAAAETATVKTATKAPTVETTTTTARGGRCYGTERHEDDAN